MITINEIKKGDRIRMANGWYGTMLDNHHSPIFRRVEVEGASVQIGTVYVRDIVQARHNGEWMAVTHTPEQMKAHAEDFFGFHYDDHSNEEILP
jgi:hypothetical protein